MKTTTAGLSILAGGLAFAGTAGAVDLIVNGSFEDGVGVGWSGAFGTYNFSAAYFAGPAIPESENPGSLYSWRHGLGDQDFTGPLTQVVSLTPTLSAADIDSGRGIFALSAWMASYTANPERPYVTVQFLDAAEAPLGAAAALDRTSGQSFVQFADGVTVFDRTTHEHYWAKYLKDGSIPPGARSARVGVTRSPNAGLSGRPDTYTDLVKLNVDAVSFVAPSFVSALPNGTGTLPDAVIKVVVQDGTTAVLPGTVQMFLDNLLVQAAVSKQGITTTIEYDPPGLLAPSSAHTVRVLATDNAAVPTTVTNEFSFSVASYYDLLLPTPLYLETFETTLEGALPGGWSGVSYSTVPDPNLDLNDLNSASYAGWTVVDSARFNSDLLSYSVHTPTDDYKRVLSKNLLNVVNGAVVENLADHKICFGNSGYRDGASQVVYLFSPDFDLTGKTNIYLSFHSLWEQNQDSVASVEYSIDQGVTWLPIVYMLDTADLVRDGEGKLDPVATLGTVYNDVAVYTDPSDQQPRGGYYGAFFGVDSNRWSELGPYISGRVNDDPIESKRVEVFRLPAADNQSKVRLRFAHAGTDSWYFGLDDVGLYSITTLNPPQVTGPSPAEYTEAVGNSAAFSVVVSGVGPFTYRWSRNNVVLPGQTSSTLALSNLQLSDQGSYRATVGYVGGSVVTAPVSLTVFTAPLSPVLGQWDFNAQNLNATCGRNMEFFDLATDLATGFADSDFYGLPAIGGQSVTLMAFPGPVGAVSSGGFKVYHGLSGTGGGTNVNQYTLIMDVLYPASSSNVRRTLLQTDPNNVTDGSFRINENNRVGVSDIYHGTVQPDIWNRIALAVDLVGPGPHPVVAKFINGVKVGQQTLTEGRDGRWSLSARPEAPYALVLGDNDVDAQPGYLSSLQLRSGRLPDLAIEAMGGPSSGKIPGAACAVRVTTGPVIYWSGTTLEEANEITGTFRPIADAPKPYPVPSPLVNSKFYRAR